MSKRAQKIFTKIGQAVVYTSGWALGVAFFYWAFLQAPVYR